MPEQRVWTFFYGSYINFNVLAEVDLKPEQYEVAQLGGFDLSIRPLANLVRSNQHSVYGVVATATHAELARLYQHAEHVLGGVYQPEAVITQLPCGCLRPALCYIAADMPPRQADTSYVNRILQPAREYGFPEWYLDKIAGFCD